MPEDRLLEELILFEKAGHAIDARLWGMAWAMRHGRDLERERGPDPLQALASMGMTVSDLERVLSSNAGFMPGLVTGLGLGAGLLWLGTFVASRWRRA